MDDHHITRLLHGWRTGNADALEQLTPLVYDQLHAIANRAFRGENQGHTLQPTALVNEAMQEIIGANVDWQDRNHFYALSARMMRRILVNHARAKGAAKRGGNAIRVTIEDSHSASGNDEIADLLVLDEALRELASFDARKAEVVELHYFGGLTYAELASVLDVAESTVHLDLRTAKAWLRQRMAE